MIDIRNHKKWIGILTILVLLSFFCMFQGKIPEKTLRELANERTGVLYTAENVCADVAKNQDRETRIVEEKGMSLEAVTQGQKTMRVVTIRFIAVVCMVLCIICMAYRIVIRRYGARMIKLWENITYIHKMDGAKGNALLYI